MGVQNTPVPWWLPSWAAAALLLLAPSALAHPLSLSGFDVFAQGREVRVDFKLDAAAVVGVINRAQPGQPTTPLSGIKAHRQRVFDYLASHFRIGNDGKSCVQQPVTDLLVHEQNAKVFVQLHFACPSDLQLLTIESTIFNEESPAPQVLCTFHYQRALEHYFFSAGMRIATIAVRELRQVLPAEIDNRRPFEMAEPPPGAYDASAARAEARSQSNRGGGFLAFVWQGVLHILGGLDHVLFVVTLVIAVRTRGELILIVSSFTVAHSISLVLGTFDLLTASPRLVEPLIALSIVYVAVENIVRRVPAARRPAVTFGFGLVHGLGFSSALRELGLPPRQLVAPLLGFNVGVELGQLAIVLPLLPLIVWLRGREGSKLSFARIVLVTNAVVAALACAWFVQRLLGD
jgi:hydrogenase/urease accessory protein HupE